jgi:hypothetical protein
MTQTATAAVEDTVSFTLSRKVAADIVHCSSHLADRLHHLLERNTDGLLNPTEQAELEALADLAQVKQLLAMALGEPGAP